MAAQSGVTKEMIIDEASRIVAREGPEGLTFQALADALAVSKQAILYWYPSKWELVQDFGLAALRAEAAATIAAIADASTASEAIERFLKAQIAHHLADLGRFRVIYLGMQFERWRSLPQGARKLIEPIHQVTSTMFAALEKAIAADPHFCGGESPRRLAVSVHMAGVGILTMLSLADSLDDPLAHETGALIKSMVTLLTGRAGTGSEAGLSDPDHR